MGLTRTRNRISLAQELRIWDLRRQGYRLDQVARICNLPWRSVATAAYRARLHWKYQGDPRLGRKRGWLSDQDVAEIRARRNQGETLERIARAYDISAQTVSRITRGCAYQEPCGDQGYAYSFANRLISQAQVQ